MKTVIAMLLTPLLLMGALPMAAFPVDESVSAEVALSEAELAAEENAEGGVSAVASESEQESVAEASLEVASEQKPAGKDEDSDLDVPAGKDEDSDADVVSTQGLRPFSRTMDDDIQVLAENITVTFDLGYDTGVDEDTYEAVTLPGVGTCEKPADPIREGYIFAGWYTGQGSLFVFSTPIDEDMVLTAKWAAPSDVSTALELQTAVDNAPDGELTVLTLARDIEIKAPIPASGLVIPAGKVIRLQGAGHKLIPTKSSYTAVNVYGTLTIDGVTVTNNGRVYGNYFTVYSGGVLTMASGELTDNGWSENNQHAVYVEAGGTFIMTGGSIHDNYGWQGTAVYNKGVFTLSGGEIHDNARGHSAVYNLPGGVFTMSGGEIYGHQGSGGCGVNSRGTFTMTGGKIRDNTAWSYGAGVAAGGVFNMEGGEIYNNHSNGTSRTAGGGGGVMLSGGAATKFTMTGGKIYGNSSTYAGGGIYVYEGAKVAINGGEIYNNTAPHGGGVFMEYVNGWKAPGTPMVSPGLEYYENLTVGPDAVFYGNSAEAAYGRDPVADAVYASNIAGSQWTAPFTQGYNNYDINHVYGAPAVIHTVTFVDWDDTVLKIQMVEQGDDATAPAGPTREAYTFDGWDRGFTDVQSSFTVKARYTPVPVTHSVSYAPGEHGTFTVVTHTGLVAGVTTPAAPDISGETGWAFTGWTPAPAATVTETVTYTAQWTAAATPSNLFSVTFVDWDDTVLKIEEVARGGSATAPGNPGREGYAFTSWDRGYTDVQSDITVTALYVVNPATGTEEQPGTNPPGGTVPPLGDDDVTEPGAADILVPIPSDDIAVPNAIDPLDPTPEEVLTALTDEGISSTTIGEQEVPLAAGSFTRFVWALLNLILALTGAILAVLCGIHVLRRKRRERNDREDETYVYETEEETRKRKRIRPVWLIATILMSVAGIVLFFLTEDMSRLMVLVDDWTPVNAAILLAELVGIFFSFKSEKAPRAEGQPA